jgi:hypothetical protein
MLRKLLGVFAIAALMCAGVVMAEEIKGRIMKVDVDKKVLTVKDGDKEREILVDDKADLGKNKDGSERSLDKLAKQVEKAGDKGVGATITTERKKGKDVATKVEVKGGKGKGKGTDK